MRRALADHRAARRSPLAARRGVAARRRRGADDEQRYTVVLDNAFGLTEGVGPARPPACTVGSVAKLDVAALDRRARWSTVERHAARTSRGFRADVFCEVKPQSLIGEYFLDCEPGKARRAARRATIPVEQTAGTIPPDLVLDILRRPARERFGLILTELGDRASPPAATDLQTTIRRARPGAARDRPGARASSPPTAARCSALTRDADRVLAGARRQPRATSRASSREARRHDAGLRRAAATSWPTTVRQAARLPARAAPDAARPRHRRRPADARRCATCARAAPRPHDAAAAPRPVRRRRRGRRCAALGEASETGIARGRATARSTVEQLRDARHGRARSRCATCASSSSTSTTASAPSSRTALSPGGAGFTGLEALLQYLFVQSQAINIFDSKGYIAQAQRARQRVLAVHERADRARATPSARERCNAVARAQPARRHDAARSRARATSPRAPARDARRRATRRRTPPAPAPRRARGSAARPPPPPPPPPPPRRCPTRASCSTTCCPASPTSCPASARRGARAAPRDRQRAQPPRLPPRAMRGRRPRIGRRQPGPRRGGHDARRRRRRAARLQRQPRACRSSRPTQLKVDAPNAARLVVGNEVREGGFRIGQVTKIEPVAAAAATARS